MASEGSLVELSEEPLSLERYVAAVADDGAGAISTFIGVTRNTFQGRRVVRLEYEAYAPMALRELQGVVGRMRARWDVRRVAIAHRTGIVPVGEASVVIAVSSAHRLAALEAVHFCIDDLKATVPIWKKEVYEPEVSAAAASAWKANAPM